ncbi:MAG: hypothetical protein WA891_09165 [Acidobacteriaceae bacterium]
MQRSSIVLAGLGIFLLLALPTPGSQAAQQSTPPNAAVAPEFPGFTVKLTFSENASKTLIARKETVVVAAYLYGDPKPGAPKRYVDEMGQVNLGEVDSEVAPDKDAPFQDFKLKKDALLQLETHGPQLLINAFSGRKSSPDNLLDCGIYEGPLKTAAQANIKIACKLIGE